MRSGRWAPWARPGLGVNDFPERRPCRRAGVVPLRVVVLRYSLFWLLRVLLSAFFDKVAVKIELTDERVDLPKADRWLRSALQINAHEAVVIGLHFQSGGASI